MNVGLTGKTDLFFPPPLLRYNRDKHCVSLRCTMDDLIHMYTTKRSPHYGQLTHPSAYIITIFFCLVVVRTCKTYYHTHYDTQNITDKSLLYSTGRPIRCSVMTSMGMESRREGIYANLRLSHCAAQQKRTQHCQSTLLQ